MVAPKKGVGGNVDDGHASRSKDTKHLGGHFSVLLHMFHDIQGDDDIEGSLGKGKTRRISTQKHRPAPPPGEGKGLGTEVRPDNLVTTCGKITEALARATSKVKNSQRPAQLIGVLLEHHEYNGPSPAKPPIVLFELEHFFVFFVIQEERLPR